MSMFDQIMGGILGKGQQPDASATSGPGAGLTTQQKLLTGIFGGTPTRHAPQRQGVDMPLDRSIAGAGMMPPTPPQAGGYSAMPQDPLSQIMMGTGSPSYAGGYSAMPQDPLAQLRSQGMIAGLGNGGGGANPNTAAASHLAQLLGVNLGQFGVR